MAPEARFAITGVGMRCAVGQCAAQSAAAVRAGISGFSEWKRFPVSFGPEGTGVVAAVVRPDLGDEPWVRKAGSLVLQPMLEALWEARVYLDAPHGRLGVYLGVPPPGRDGLEEGEDAEYARGSTPPDWLPAGLDRWVVRREGTPAALLALSDAMADLQSGAVEVAVVGGVDSLVHGELMGALLDEGRLKTPESPAGLIPGEAAAFLVLERPASARSRAVPALGWIDGVVTSGNPCEFEPERPSVGKETSDLLRRALGTASCGAGRVARVIADLNGERWRFLDWAMADARSLSVLAPGWRLWYPADSWGDIGAASGAAFVVLAVRAFARGYAGGDGILAATMSESSVRAAAVITAM